MYIVVWMVGKMWAGVMEVSREGDFTSVMQITLFIYFAVGYGVPVTIRPTAECCLHTYYSPIPYLHSGRNKVQ